MMSFFFSPRERLGQSKMRHCLFWQMVASIFFSEKSDMFYMFVSFEARIRLKSGFDPVSLFSFFNYNVKIKIH